MPPESVKQGLDFGFWSLGFGLWALRKEFLSKVVYGKH